MNPQLTSQNFYGAPPFSNTNRYAGMPPRQYGNLGIAVPQNQQMYMQPIAVPPFVDEESRKDFYEK